MFRLSVVSGVLLLFAPQMSAQEVTLSGEVHDSLWGGPYSGQPVLLHGRAAPVETDPIGQFHMESVEVGPHTILIPHPLLDTLGLSPFRYEIEISEEASDVHVHLPSIPTVAMQLCRVEGYDSDGVIAGRILVEDRGENPGEDTEGVTVVADWQAAGGARSTTSGPVRGDIFRICGVPLDVAVRLRASSADGLGPPEVRRLATTRSTRADLRLAASGTTAVELRIRDVDSGEAIAGAAVELEGVGTGVSDESGRVRWPAVEEGRYRLQIEHIAYGTISRDLDIEGRAVPEIIDIEVVSAPFHLEGFEVSAQRPLSIAMEGFHRRMEQGTGSYITREMLAQREGAPLATIIDQIVPSIRRRCGMVGGIPQCYLESSRRTPSFIQNPACKMVYVVDNVQMEIPFDNLDRFLEPWQVEAVEVYAGPSQTPTEFRRLNTRCGVTVIWTRQPGSPLESGGI